MDWLAYVSGFLLILGLRYLVTWPLRRARAAMHGDDEVEGTPFSETEYAENRAGSQDWEFQQALRRAGMLEKKGKLAEAVKILVNVRNAVKDPHAREVLDREIRRLGGTPPEAPAAPAPVRKDEPDPYADRMK